MKKSERFLRRLFQAAVEIIKKRRRRLPLSISTAVAVSTSFPFPHVSFFLLLFLSLLPAGMSRPGTHPGIGELEDRFQLLMDLLRQLKWVVRLERLVQLHQLCSIRLSAFTHAFQWRLRWLVHTPQARADSCFSQQLRRWLKQILVHPQLRDVQVVYLLQYRCRIESQVAEDFPNMRPVLLFNVRIVIFLVRPALV